ncbi:MAG: RNA polymerase-binding protein RbpA [Actinomycetota bacterium]|nr:RNA polymerase-binding protein RbpA [Actinomycetota bacterium]
MGERVLRGSRLGAVSYESDRNTDLAPRQETTYDCPEGHRFSMPFAVEAEIPAIWECKVCGAPALRVDGELPEPKKVKPARTHWDMLMERRTFEDLEEVLNERLTLLRGSNGTKKSA